MKYAIIDIGSNSVRLMLWADGKTLYKRLQTTRLSAGLALSGVLGEEAMSRSVSAVSAFCAEGERMGAKPYAFATAAVRSARNGQEFCKRVFEACGLNVDVVSGEHEALLGVYGALGAEDGGMIDVGGASAEVCMRQGGKTLFSVSLPVGAVRLHDTCNDDIALLDAEIDKVLPMLNGAPRGGKIYAVGGTASTLASVKLGLKEYDAEKLQNLAMPRVWVRETANRLLAMPVAARAALAGMEPNRADIIAGGAYLIGRLMDTLGWDNIYFSDRDNLEGYLTYRGLV